MGMLRATLTDSMTGVSASTWRDYPWIDGGEESWRSVWYWAEGNFGCDCNRGEILGLDVECSHGGENRIHLDQITIDGELVYPEG